MRGMDEGSWTSLGTLGWFLGVWVVMMAAMMLPSAWPTVTLYSRMLEERSALAPLLFVVGYLATWTAVGVIAFTLAEAGGNVAGGAFASGIAPAAGSPERRCSPQRCTSSRRSRTPASAGAAARSASLSAHGRTGPPARFAWACEARRMVRRLLLGADGVAVRTRRDELEWMAFVAALIAIEKLIRWRRVATGATAAVLAVLAVVLVARSGGYAGRSPRTAGRPRG